MPRRYDIVLMDADRTLFDFDRSEHEAVVRVLTAFGLPADRETEETYLRENRAVWDAFDRGELPQEILGRERFVRFLRAVGREELDPEEMNRAYVAMLGELPYLLPGALELCQALHDAGCRLIIVTNGLTVAQTGRLARSPLAPLIERMYISEQLGCQKPERRFFDLVFADLGLTEAQRQRTVLLGDSLTSDILGGIRAGLDTIWFNQSGQKVPKGLNITCIADNLTKVRSVILPECGEAENFL